MKGHDVPYFTNEGKIYYRIGESSDPEVLKDKFLFEQLMDRRRNFDKNFDNFAKNGRINPILAKGIGILGIKIVGNASEEGTLNPMDKCRGYKRAFKCLISHMKECGYAGGRVIISHTNNPDGAAEINEMIKTELGYNDAPIMENRGLCSYYAEPGSVLIGFEA